MTANLEASTTHGSDTQATPVFAAPIRPVHPYIRSRGILPVAGRTPSFDWNSIIAVRR
jgi:hypothetical protein